MDVSMPRCSWWKRALVFLSALPSLKEHDVLVMLSITWAIFCTLVQKLYSLYSQLGQLIKTWSWCHLKCHWESMVLQQEISKTRKYDIGCYDKEAGSCLWDFSQLRSTDILVADFVLFWPVSFNTAFPLSCAPQRLPLFSSLFGCIWPNVWCFFPNLVLTIPPMFLLTSCWCSSKLTAWSISAWQFHFQPVDPLAFASLTVPSEDSLCSRRNLVFLQFVAKADVLQRQGVLSKEDCFGEALRQTQPSR